MNSSHILSAVQKAPSAACLLGFDGFCDDIYRAVDRQGIEGPSWIPTLTAFAERVGKAAGRSGNIELVLQRSKVGGNAPIMAQALASAGHRVTLAAAVGDLEPEPLFSELESLCAGVIPLGQPGRSDALEFDDGKLILGKLDGLQDIGVERLLKAASSESWLGRVEEAGLLAAVNWTMLPRMSEIWRFFADELGPKLSRRPYFFVDLADPAKRSDEDLGQALKILTRLQASYDVILGLNFAEAERLALLFGHAQPKETPDAIETTAVLIRQELDLAQVAVHPRHFAAAASLAGSWTVVGPEIGKPVLSTGGGDNFNAGYCHGLLCGLEPGDALFCAVAWSGFYVSQARSPQLGELENFMRTKMGLS